MPGGKDYRFLKSTLGKVAGDGLLQGFDDKLERGVEYSFLVGIVNDVISNPNIYLRNKVDADPSVTVGEVLSGRKKVEGINIGIKNKDLVETAPINSIIAQIADPGQASTDGALPVLCYPFFPPHFSLPLNPGEYVWILEADMKGAKMYYWLCRQVGPRQIDDINFTNMERLVSAGSTFRQFMKNQGAKDVPEEALEKSISLDNADKTNSKDSFDKIFNNSYAYRTEFTGEPVPRMAKNCGDLLLQGSNNAGIHLTTEKFSTASGIQIGELPINPLVYSGKTNPIDTMPTRKPDAAAIDMFVTRKKSSLDKLKEATKTDRNLDSLNVALNNCSNELYTYIENDKMADLRYHDDAIFDKELNDEQDSLDIGARVYLSHQCAVDQVFEINFDDLKKPATRQKLGPSILTYAKHNRVVGEDDVRVVSRLGKSFIDLDEEGNITAKASKTQGKQFLRLEPGVQGNATINANGTIYLQDKALQSFVRAEDLAIELTKLKAAISVMANALTSGGFCPFPAGPNAVLGTAMGVLASSLESVQVTPTSPWVSKKIKGE